MAQTRRNFIKTLLGAAALASAGPVLSTCVTLENKLRNIPEGRLGYETIAHECLDIEIGFGVTIDDYFVLDDFINEAKEKIETKEKYTKKEAIGILKTIDEIIDGKGFDKKTNDFLNQGLKDKKLDCDNRTLVYLGIAEVLNLPLNAIDVPRHSFIRWHDNKGTSFNWETMEVTEKPDSHYINKYDIPETSIKNGAYLKSLNRKETYSFAYRVRGIAFAELKKYKESLKDYNKALKVNPKDPSTHYNKSIALRQLNKPKEAMISIDKALELNPNYASAYYSRGNIFLKFKEYEKALDAYDLAITAYESNIIAYTKVAGVNKYTKKLHIKKSKAYLNKGVALHNLKRYNEAILCYDQTLKINPSNNTAIKNKEKALKKLRK